MSTEAIIGFVGAVLGSAVSLGGVVLSQYLIKKNDDRKDSVAKEDVAITEVYSPLVFLLDRTRELFVSIISLEKTLENHPEPKKSNFEPFILQYYIAKRAARHPKAFEDLLIKNAALMNPILYYDLLTFQSYLDTTYQYLDYLIIPSIKEPDELQKRLRSFGPIIKELDLAVEHIRTYSAKKVIRSKSKYVLFFDPDKNSKFEKCVDEINITITGAEIPDWDNILKCLQKDESNSKNTKKGKS
ncbi:MAG: hypothetical protein ACFCUE_03970 [Candidatus Bathyarchaeia archaeon]|jgi:hypothetical protein